MRLRYLQCMIMIKLCTKEEQIMVMAQKIFQYTARGIRCLIMNRWLFNIRSIDCVNNKNTTMSVSHFSYDIQHYLLFKNPYSRFIKIEYNIMGLVQTTYSKTTNKFYVS